MLDLTNLFAKLGLSKVAPVILLLVLLVLLVALAMAGAAPDPWGCC